MSEVTLNDAKVTGEIITELELSNEICGEKFYKFILGIRRLSGVIDKIPVMLSERLVRVEKLPKGTIVCVNGEYRSHTDRSKNGSHLDLYVFVKNLEILDSAPKQDINSLDVVAYLVKKGDIRHTKSNRAVIDLLVAVNRGYGKSSYLPMIAWERSARFIEQLAQGTKLRINGRIQSREYHKKVKDEYETRTAYEVSIFSVTEENE